MKRSANALPDYPTKAAYVLRLFIADDEPRSKTAKQNLARICEAHLGNCHQLEIIDVLEDFQAALEDNVFVTPTLILVAPEPKVTVVGSLTDTDRVLAALRITG